MQAPARHRGKVDGVGQHAQPQVCAVGFPTAETAAAAEACVLSCTGDYTKSTAVDDDLGKVKY